MSIESVAIALHHSQTRGATKLVLLGIANHDGDGGAWPAISTLAKYAGITSRHAIRCVRQLEAIGEIETVVGGGGVRSDEDHTRPNLYRFLLRCPEDCDGTGQHRRKNLPLTSRSGGDMQAMPPPDAQVSPPLTPKSAKPSEEPSRKPDRRKAGTFAGAGIEEALGFRFPASVVGVGDSARVAAILLQSRIETGQARQVLAAFDEALSGGEVRDPWAMLAELTRRAASGKLILTAHAEARLPKWV